MTSGLRLLNGRAGLTTFSATALSTLWTAGLATLPVYAQFALSAGGTADWRQTMEFWTSIVRFGLTLRS
jgi:hypothetical protein